MLLIFLIVHSFIRVLFIVLFSVQSLATLVGCLEQWSAVTNWEKKTVICAIIWKSRLTASNVTPTPVHHGTMEHGRNVMSTARNTDKLAVKLQGVKALNNRQIWEDIKLFNFLQACL